MALGNKAKQYGKANDASVVVDRYTKKTKVGRPNQLEEPDTLNIRLEKRLKEDFALSCKINGTTTTEAIIGFMEKQVGLDEEKIQKIKELL